MKLMVQPDDGSRKLIEAIDRARQRIDMYVFRLAHPGVEAALTGAIARGVVVRTLVAHINSGGDERLRTLELQLLKIGATVSRSDDDLLRYHGKMMIVDHCRLLVLGFNFTTKDIERSRSLGVETEDPALVTEAQRLFDADFDRRTYTANNDNNLVVSPLNSRASLLELIEGAGEQLLIYDSRLTDNLMQKAIERKALAGISVRVIGKVEKKLRNVGVQCSGTERMHVRAIVQDQRRVFIGSQSLRRAELERRREIGIIVSDHQVVQEVTAIFERDWALGASGEKPRLGGRFSMVAASP
jgi:cardiolipin synthase A/B